jgi:glycosyltransferase involved in cell wall biosynthesis
MICSTIIPTVNRPSLERAVKSALEQDLGLDDYEIIVVNDSGSPLPHVDWLNSPQIKIVNTNRCERSVACNVGAALASGEYIKILHDDDQLLPDSLKKLIDKAESTRCSWVYGAHNRVDNNGVLMSINRPEVRGNLFAHFVAGDVFHLGASLFRRDVFFEVGCFDPIMKTAEDRDLQQRIALVGYFDRIDDLVASIRIGTSGITTTDWDKSTYESRLIREKCLNSVGALSKIVDSVKDDIDLRGRCCRAYFISALLNLRKGNILVAISRIFHVIPLIRYFIIFRKFWQGFFKRSHWHAVEMKREEEHYAIYNG